MQLFVTSDRAVHAAGESASWTIAFGIDTGNRLDVEESAR